MLLTMDGEDDRLGSPNLTDIPHALKKALEWTAALVLDRPLWHLLVLGAVTDLALFLAGIYFGPAIRPMLSESIAAFSNSFKQDFIEISFSNGQVIFAMIGISLFNLKHKKWDKMGGVITGVAVGASLGPPGMAAGIVSGLASGAYVSETREDSDEEKEDLGNNRMDSTDTRVYDPSEDEGIQNAESAREPES